ncbi:MAG: hypothetical protein KDA73_16745 [Rhodobacteraceae bacterium]|nr:hypothetical protein [Paracoccaceae bacterium]
MTDRQTALRWIAPNLLDAIADPELVYALTLANLMSPRLWDIVARIRAEAGEEPRDIAARAAQYIDHHFEHVPPAQLFEMYGTLDLERQAERIGADTIRYALESINDEFAWREARNLTPETLDVPRFRRGEVPAFTYGTIDEAHACRRLLGHRHHKPLGLTCCVDEAALYAALLLAFPEFAAARLFFLMEPSHCTVMHWNADDAHWYYSKKLQFSRQDWRRLVTQDYAGDVQLAFDDKLHDCDTIATAEGLVTCGESGSTLDLGRHAATIDIAERFLGAATRQLTRLRQEATVGFREELAHPGVLFASLGDFSGAADVAERIRSRAFDARDPFAVRALHVFRAVDVPDPSVYLFAGHSSGLAETFLPRPTSVEECLSVVRACEGTESIFDDRDRIALPDETMRYRTGSDRDKALLLHVLLDRMDGWTPGRSTRWRTTLGARRAIVDGPGLRIDAESLMPAEAMDVMPIAVLGGT